MTGGGAASLSFVKADGFLSIPGTPTHYLPGRNPTVQDLSLDNQLQRLRTPDNAEAVDSLAGNLDGAFAVNFAMSHDVQSDVHDVVFNDAGAGFTPGQAALSRWYVGTDYLASGSTATVERELRGCIPLEWSVSYQQGTNTIQQQLRMGYADEQKNTSITPSTITGPTDGNDVPFHGADLSVDAATVNKLQSATLSISNISRFQRGASRTALDAVLAAPQVSLEAAAIYGGDEYLELAYGSSGSTSTQDSISNVTGSLTFEVAGNTAADYTLSKVKPNSYEWSDLIDAETDLTDPTTYHVNGGITVA